MKQVLKKFVTTEGVLGAYVLSPEDGVFESYMPKRFNEESLQQIGHNLTGLTDLARSDFSDPEDISFLFEKAALRIRDFNDGYHFIALFSPKMNRDVLGKATDTFIDEFGQAIAPPPELSSAKPTDNGQGQETSAQSAKALSPEDLMSSDTLADPLDKMQSALFKVVGPMAKIVFYDALKQWLIIDTPCMDSLPLLTDIVLKEIGDEGLVNDFKERLPSFCYSPSPESSPEQTNKRKKT